MIEKIVVLERDPKKEIDVWDSRIKKARTFDENARKMMQLSRSYARGDSSFKVSVNLLASFIDVLQAFLFAQQPEPEVLPAPQVGKNRTPGLDQFATTAEVVAAKLWRCAKLKDRAEPWLRSALTTGLGWLKASWQDSTERDPVIQSQIDQLMENQRQLKAKIAELVESGQDVEDMEVRGMEIAGLIEGLEARVERMVARGLVIDTVSPEDITIPEGVAQVSSYLDSPWIDHRIFMSVNDVMQRFQVSREPLLTAVLYTQRKPEYHVESSTPYLSGGDEDRLDQFVRGDKDGSGKVFLAVHETWDRDTGQVFVWAEGVNVWLREPSPPVYPTTQFYPFFLLGFLWVDGERYPQSHVYRSFKLIDEYNRSRSALAKHRRRIIPRLLFDASMLSPEEAEKISGIVEGGSAGSAEQELIALRLNKSVPVDQVIHELRYARIDQALYSTAEVRADLEAIWGVQEALAGTIQTAKTATEATIQQSGTQARTQMMRDRIESVLTQLLRYTIELSLSAMTAEEVREIAGIDAVWPEGVKPEDLDLMANINIRAGSTGKPNQSLNQQAWATVMPILQNTVAQIAQLRQSRPEEIARALEEIVIETMARTGDRSDPARFLPQAPGGTNDSGNPTSPGIERLLVGDQGDTTQLADITGIRGPQDPNG